MKINQIKKAITILLLCAVGAVAQENSTEVNAFTKVIISPHIQVTFVQGTTESVTVENSTVSADKINIEVSGKTLRVYLDGAKEVTKNEKTYNKGYKQKESLYKGTVVKAIITYKNIEELSLRGSETTVCKSPFVQSKLRLKIYGESQVYLNEVQLHELQTTVYGESLLEIKSGSIESQKITAYGETKINTLGVQNNNTKITAYGEGSYRVMVAKRLKVTAYGEATVAYTGDPELSKGLVIGETIIQKIQ